MTYHPPVPPEGPEVFPAEEGKPFMLAKVNGKLIRIRVSEVPAVRAITPDEYCDGKPTLNPEEGR